MTVFIYGEMQSRVQDGFSILLPMADALSMFRDNLNISCITEFPQAHFQPRLILNLLAKPNYGTPSVNDTTDREVALELMKFGQAFPCILQAIWEADPDEVPVRVSKMDITDAYHRGTLWPSQVGTFTYVVPSAPEEYGVIICIYLVLPIG